jgi:hypothetical protein
LQVCTNHKTAPDHDTHSKTSDSNIIIDSIVLLSTDTAMNRKRLEGTRRPLEQFGGKEELVSRNVPFAVLQAERNNPSTAAQKINNIEQLWEASLDLFDSCSWFHYTDKGPDHNPEFREVILTLAMFFRKRGLCYFNNRVHAGGLSAFNTVPERLNAGETKELCNVPLNSQPFGDAVDLERGVVDEEKVKANLQWELDEVQSRLSEGSFVAIVSMLNRRVLLAARSCANVSLAMCPTWNGTLCDSTTSWASGSVGCGRIVRKRSASMSSLTLLRALNTRS